MNKPRKSALLPRKWSSRSRIYQGCARRARNDASIFVAVVEAYLKDVFIYASGIDASLMDRTGQTVTYQDAVNQNPSKNC